MLQPHIFETDEVVRVAVNNNFNCTDEEYLQLNHIAAKNPTKSFFINSNINTAALYNINKYPYKAVITANPDLTVNWNAVARLYPLDPKKISFVRVKWLPENEEIKKLISTLIGKGYQVVITMQRFNSKKSLLKYSSLDHYTFSHNRYRLSGSALEKLHSFVDSNKTSYICDRAGLGCKGCNLCSTMNTGKNLKLSSLNLSSSGICKFNCPDCYAKTMQHFLESMGKPIMKYDCIKSNHKQSGSTKHIKDNKKALV